MFLLVEDNYLSLAVFDKGCGSIIMVFLLWLCGWVPGVIAALVILNNPKYQNY
jgi:hypothetical protein